MTLEPIDRSGAPLSWPFEVPEQGLTAADLDRMPGLPPHTELIDGGLFFVSPQSRFHDRMLERLKAGLQADLPPDLDVAREMSMVIDRRNRPEPDLSVIKVEALGDGSETSYPAEAVLLAVEVVSPSSVTQDRELKPKLYAEAGVAHHWRVEPNHGDPVVYVYELDVARNAYTPTGIFHGRLTLKVPYPIDIDLTGLDRRS